MKHSKTIKLTLSAMFLALGFVLPFFTGQIPQIGNMLLPMHLPVLLCGLICGWQYGLVIGLCLPLVRSMIFGMPPIFPTGIAMTFELGRLWPDRWSCLSGCPPEKYTLCLSALIIAMIGGQAHLGHRTRAAHRCGFTGFHLASVFGRCTPHRYSWHHSPADSHSDTDGSAHPQRTAPTGESTGCEGLTYGTDCFYHPAKDSQTAERPSPSGHRNRRQMRSWKDHTSPTSFSGAFLFGHPSGPFFPSSTAAHSGTLKTGRRKF